MPIEAASEFGEPVERVLTPTELQAIAELRAVQRSESFACIFCDGGMELGSLEEAFRKGWTELQIDDGWNYLGLCPDCKSEYL